MNLAENIARYGWIPILIQIQNSINQNGQIHWLSIKRYCNFGKGKIIQWLPVQQRHHQRGRGQKFQGFQLKTLVYTCHLSFINSKDNCSFFCFYIITDKENKTTEHACTKKFYLFICFRQKIFIATGDILCSFILPVTVTVVHIYHSN